MQREFALPGTRPRYAPDRTCDIEHIKIDLDLDVDRRRIQGRCSLTLTPIVSELRRVRLDAVELDIKRVSSEGEELAFSHDGKVLRVDLDRPRGEGERITLEVQYRGSPRRGLYFVGPDEAYPEKPRQVWTQGQDEDSRYWFPCFDAPHEKATSEVIATVPGDWFALSNGVLVGDAEEGGRRTFHWRHDHPHSAYLITLVAGELSEIRDRWDDVEIAYYAHPAREEETRRTLGRTPEMVELFSRLFRVDYPYEKYAQVFVADFIFGGMENTTATTLTDIILLDERAALDFDAESLVAHELAHQWFGDLLTCRSWGEGWLNEGFATYAEYLWREHAEGRDAAALELEDWAEQYFSEDSKRYRRTVATNVYDEPIDIFDSHLYEKGGRVLHMLRRVLGDDAFWRSIEHYLTKHRLGSVETRDLNRAVEEATGRVLDWFFDQWITRGAGHPELEVSYAWEADDGLARVTVKQTQKVDRQTPLFRIPTRIRFRVDGRDRDFDVELTEEQHTVYFGFEREPEQVIFDPGKDLLARVKEDKPLPVWIAELEDADEAIDRIYAARELSRRGGTRATGALVRALGEDPFWGVRAAAAEALGELRTGSARDALLRAATETRHPKARRAVVRALGKFRRDEGAAETLAGIVERGDPSYFVEAEACLAFGRTRSPRALEVLRRAAGRESFLDVIRQYAYRGLAEAGAEEAIPLLREGTEYGEVPHGRRAALRALAELTAGRRDRAAKEARERLEELLEDPDFRVQLASVEALGVLGDTAAIPALERATERALDGRLKRRGREVVRDLKEGEPGGEQLRSLREELEKLRGEAAALREKLAKLEERDRPAAGRARPHKKEPLRRKGGGKKTARTG